MPTSTRRYTNGQGVIKPDGGWLLRPFLSLSRAQLHHYAVQHNIAHIEDPSNNDCAYDRNALRHQVMPHLAAIRPGYQKTLARSAALLAEANELLDALAEIDLASDVTRAQTE